jgi:hypothetical protein
LVLCLCRLDRDPSSRHAFWYIACVDWTVRHGFFCLRRFINEKHAEDKVFEFVCLNPKYSVELSASVLVQKIEETIITRRETVGWISDGHTSHAPCSSRLMISMIDYVQKTNHRLTIHPTMETEVVSSSVTHYKQEPPDDNDPHTTSHRIFVYWKI